MRFFPYWDRISQSLWFVPSVLTAVAAIAAYVTVEVDRNWVDPELVRSFWFVFDVGSDGARATLGAIAQSVITVTGVVFSVTIVALQLAASQFTPRVLRTFLSDRANQIVLGIFIATFTYTLLVVRTVGTPFDADAAFVPSISVTVSILLSLVSIGALIFFINHIAQSIRASQIISHVTHDARKLIDELFPSTIGAAEEEVPLAQDPPNVVAHLSICAEKAGYLQGIDEDQLFGIAEEGRAVIRMDVPVGDFVLPHENMASVWFDDAEFTDEEREKMEQRVREAFVIGNHWTLGQDFERALVELTDIAVRALSPGINDPTTANLCVDRLGELLILLGNRKTPSAVRADGEGKIRFYTRRLSWSRAVDVAFAKVRHYGAGSPSVALRMLEICGRVRAQVPLERRGDIERQIGEIVESARIAIATPADLERVVRAAEIAGRSLTLGGVEVGRAESGGRTEDFG